MTTVAVLKLGSTTFRARVYDLSQGQVRLLEERRLLARAGILLGSKGDLLTSAAEEVAIQVAALWQEIAAYRPVCCAGIATGVFREAPGARAALDRVRDRYGWHIEIISPEEEGRMTRLAAEAFLNRSEFTLVDIGGSSTELVWPDGQVFSVRLGTTSFGLLAPQAVLADQVDQMRHSVRMKLGDLAACFKVESPLVGVGSALLTLLRLRPGLYQERSGTVTCHEITEMIERRTDPRFVARLQDHLEPERLELFLSGAVIAEQVLHSAVRGEITVVPASTADGALVWLQGQGHLPA